MRLNPRMQRVLSLRFGLEGNTADARGSGGGARHHARARPPARVACAPRVAGSRARPRALPPLLAGTTGDVDRRFVDCHSHVVPSGDDGASTIQDGLALCRSAADHGTAVLFATPHVWPYFTLSAEREASIRAAFDRMRPYGHARAAARLRADARSCAARRGPAPLRARGNRLRADGSAVLGPAGRAVRARGACRSSGSATGDRASGAHGGRASGSEGRRGPRRPRLGAPGERHVAARSPRPGAGGVGWSLLEDGLGKIVASDGHRATRPARLDEAYAQAEQRLGERALSLFDGSVLGVRPARTASRAASTGA